MNGPTANYFGHWLIVAQQFGSTRPFNSLHKGYIFDWLKKNPNEVFINALLLEKEQFNELAAKGEACQR
jgi:hypothetical protein